MTVPRYAVYWTPPARHPLWTLGCAWLADARVPAHAARRYGFHATLRAPLALPSAARADDFVAAVRALAQRLPRFPLPALTVATLADFVALRPVAPVGAAHPLHRLADTLVRELAAWRAPADAPALRADAQRRGLSQAQQALQARWGYAHVFEHWRFHLSLSDPLGPDGTAERARLVAQAQAFFADALAEPLACEDVCVFVEPGPGASFELLARLPLAH